jgi:hypothetical protein
MLPSAGQRVIERGKKGAIVRSTSHQRGFRTEEVFDIKIGESVALPTIRSNADEDFPIIAE